jgi:hypothetical protein
LFVVLSEHRTNQFLPESKHPRLASRIVILLLIDDHTVWVGVLSVVALVWSNWIVVSIHFNDSVDWRHVHITIDHDRRLRNKGMTM